MEQINLTIIIPTLNSYKIIGELIGSLKKQIYKKWEVLFIDGNSNTKHKKYLLNICSNDKRFRLVEENKAKGIYSAMSYGMKKVNPKNWILFMGSDDKLSDNYVLEKIIKELNINSKSKKRFDVIFCKSRYIKGKKLRRISSFFKKSNYKIFSSQEIKEKLFWGYCPPHQGTIIGPNVRKLNLSFSHDYSLAGDLDYLLLLTQQLNLKYKSIDLEISLLESDGISNKQTFKRIIEVIKIYKKFYGFLFFVPLFLRYLRRIKSKYNIFYD
tara:strand:- start:4511 stop:5317 length:807 start_codon:yes stop_codon:yes gene_type:complete